MTFGEFMTAFKIATVVQANDGLYGFGGEEFFKQIETPIYAGKTTSLLGGSSIVVEPGVSGISSTGKGNDITYTGLIIEQ